MATTAGRGGGYPDRGGNGVGRWGGIFDRKRGKQLKSDDDGGSGGLRRAVGALDLMALGIGGTIGTGIFVIIGEAIGKSGPAIILSFALAGITCVFSALSYSELAAAIPISGSAYTYSYATLGELVAWIIGWDLIIEYGFSVSTIAVGWGGYLKDLLDSLFSINLPDAITAPPGDGGTVNLFAAGLVLAVMCLLLAGVRESTRANTVLVLTKLLILVFFIVIGITHFTGHHFKPFAPHGTSGTVDAAALIFFAYIGFDAVSTTGEEADNPQRDLPIGIIGSLILVTIVYILVAVAAIGLVPTSVMDGADAPLTEAIRQGAGLGDWAGDIMSFGALIAITSVVLTIYYGQTRIFFSMCRDGLVPAGRWLSKLSPRHVPIRITLLFGILIAIMAALIPLSELAELVNIGTLFAFLLVNIGVIVLRRLEPDMERPFRVPFVPIFPLIGAALCIYLMTKLQGTTWWRFGIWLAIGLLIYAFYGRFHSRVHRDLEPEPEPAS
ncbi:amino acid permease [Conexibacter woesei]|uniref:amino acid permease n=1 Tax=Conexibacter woesei TaxID=191495 RepID=UPI000403BC9E|nr:amino acid permease [Conexibacter woesei]